MGSGLSLGVGFAFLGKIMQYDAKQRLRNFVYPVIVLPCPQIDISFYLLNMSSFELGKKIKEEKEFFVLSRAWDKEKMFCNFSFVW